jgi:heme exporter protein A
MALLSVSGLSKRFGPQVGVDDVSFELAAGERAAVFGANGAGKTTLLRLLASLSRPTAGEIELDGEALLDGDASPRSRLGFLSHETMLYDELTARENVRLHARLHGVEQSRGERLLETVGLAERASERVVGFSHGMRKRVSLARALVHDPDLLLLDEPYTGLDQRSLERMTAVLESVEERAILAVTHDLARGFDLADRLLFLHDGQLVGDVSAGAFEDGAAVVEEYERRCGGRPASDVLAGER